tara:strand:+ start:149880 stop:150956 length:1077 start_codon:yes stop_codon:yes gene_type:complete
MPYLTDIQMSFPDYYYSQTQLIEKLKEIWDGKIFNTKRLDGIQNNVQVESRHLALPLEDYFKLQSFDEKNNHFIKSATLLAKDAIEKALNANGLEASDISALYSNTVTGFAIPSLEVRVMNHLKFKSDTKRNPLLGLGCMAGVAGINRACDYLLAYPKEAVLFFSVELCSLTVQTEDISVANLISTALFGDGAACVLLVGDEHPLASKSQLKWLGSKSVFFPDTENVMGWQVGEKGLNIILSKGVPEITQENIPKPFKNFLKEYQLEQSDISTYFAHPGGPKVLEALANALEITENELRHSWQSLKEKGNMSSVSVLDIMYRMINENKQSQHKHTGDYALSLAMGPAFSAELGLLKWN